MAYESSRVRFTTFIFDADQVCTTVLSQSGAKRFNLFREKVWPALAAQRPLLEKMYCRENGRPAEEPIRMLGVLILQFMERLPDRQAAEACTYDLRWKHALDLDVDELAFHPTSLVKFRNRLLEHNLDAMGFDAVLDSMRDAGYLKKKVRQRLDSTHIVGLVSRMSRLECVRETMRTTLECFARETDLERSLEWALWWDRYVESQVDFRSSPSELTGKMNQAGSDISAFLKWANETEMSNASAKALAILQRVFEENFEDNDSKIDQRRAQPPGAVHNPHDPEAQWSRKGSICTKDKEWVGYKAHVAESVELPVEQKNEPTQAVLTVVTEATPASDKSAIPRVEAELQDRSQPLPETLYVDAGYASGAFLARFESEGRSLLGPVQPSPRKGKRFSAEDFDVDINTRSAQCPAQQQNTQCSKLRDQKSGKVSYRFEWSTACHECPLRSQCLGPGQRHRTLTLSEHHNHLQARRREMKTKTFKKQMHARNGVEGTISELVRAHGLRRCRYRGGSKARLQTLMIGAACNLKRWSRRIEWESQQVLCPA
jgi:transposase